MRPYFMLLVRSIFTMKPFIKVVTLIGYLTILGGVMFIVHRSTGIMKRDIPSDVIVNAGIEDGFSKLHVTGNAEKEDRSEPAPIIVLTYMRSGSTFIGDVLQQNPDVLYLFEPLRLFQQTIRGNGLVKYLDGSERNYTEFLKLASDSIQAMTLCKFENLGVSFWNDGFLSKSNKAKAFQSCMHNSTEKQKSLKLGHCVRLLSTVCQNSKYIISKIIRIPMYLLKPLMDIFPNLKIIHLLRDPRATIRSQNFFQVIRSSHFNDDVTKFCARVYEDMITAKAIQRKYPDRFLRILYEDLSKNPLEVAKTLYNFSGIEFTAKTKEFIEKVTSGSKSSKTGAKCGYVCTLKSNSTAQAEKWRLQMSFGKVYNIDRLCQPLLKELKLKTIPSPQFLRDIEGYSLADTNQTFDDFRWA